MMRIIVITDTSFAASEAESIRILLSEGVDRVHLRKPQSAEADMRRLIEALPPELYPRLTLQDHLHLAGEYGIGGVHLNARNPEIPAGFGGLISRSCHSFGEIASHPTEDYLFSARFRQHLQNRLPSRVCTGRTPKGIRAGHHQSARRSARRHPAGTPARVTGVWIRGSGLSRVHLAGRYTRRTGAAHAGNTKIQPINRRKTIRKSV